MVLKQLGKFPNITVDHLVQERLESDSIEMAMLIVFFNTRGEEVHYKFVFDRN